MLTLWCKALPVLYHHLSRYRYAGGLDWTGLRALISSRRRLGTLELKINFIPPPFFSPNGRPHDGRGLIQIFCTSVALSSHLIMLTNSYLYSYDLTVRLLPDLWSCARTHPHPHTHGGAMR